MNRDPQQVWNLLKSFLSKLKYSKDKSMNRLKQSLEQRVFALFFIITFILVMILMLVEWQLIKLGIKQYENTGINKSLTEFSFNLRNHFADSQNLIQDIIVEKEFIDAMEVNDIIYLTNLQNELTNETKNNYIAIFDENNVQIIGEDWDLVNKYIPDIRNLPADRSSGSFLVNYGFKIYSISYSTIIRNYVRKGIIINLQSYDKNIVTTDVGGSSYLLPYPIQPVVEKLSKSIVNVMNKIDLNLDLMIDDKKNNQIFRYGTDIAVGLSVLYDLNDDPQVIYTYFYPRYVNSFTQQSFFLLVLILMAIATIIITLFGAWFRSTILHPVRNISDKMYEISVNPEIMAPLEKKYKGVLGDMVDTFNIMNNSVNDYSQNLKEYKVITNNLESGIFWLDPDFKITLCNPSFLKIFFISKMEDVIGKSLDDFIELKKQEKNKALNGNLTISNYEISIGNMKKFLFLNLHKVSGENNKKLLGFISDITAEINAKKAQEALELELIKSNRLAEIGRRVEGIVHNLNSPLNSLLGFTQLLKRDFPDNNDINKILDAGKNLAHMVKEILSKVQKDKTSMSQPLDINELITQEIELLKHNLFFKHQVNLDIDLGKDLPKINAVYGDISLCFVNIINNALETLEKSEKKNLIIRTYHQEDNVAIEITDSGEGIDHRFLNQIFEPYFTTKKTNSGSGFGLGLAISKNIIENLKGKIEIKTEIKKGSTFIMILPATE